MNYSVKVEGFWYCYPDGTQALRDINLEVEKGRKVALIGPCGAGKSTLLQAIAGYIRGSGSIVIDGLELCSHNLRKIRSVMGCYMGNPEKNLSMPTVYEDVIIGPLELNQDVQIVRRNVDFALQKLGLARLINKSSCRLSEGQKRSTAIASILASCPEIILMDEPCGGLDPQCYRNMVGLFEAMTQTVIFSTSNLRFAAEAADRVVMLSEGHIVADGDPDGILNNEILLTEHSFA